jgi:hypothetical protein
MLDTKNIVELDVVASVEGLIELYCDNNRVITQTKELRSHKKSKHILQCYHLIRDIIEREDVKVCRVDIKANTIDPLTKPLSQTKHMMHTASMGIRRMID